MFSLVESSVYQTPLFNSLFDTLTYFSVLFRTDNHPDLSSFEVKLDGINRKWVVAPDLEIIHTPVTCFSVINDVMCFCVPSCC